MTKSQKSRLAKILRPLILEVRNELKEGNQLDLGNSISVQEHSGWIYFMMSTKSQEHLVPIKKNNIPKLIEFLNQFA